jgi:uracil-DNA glycosylase
MTKRLLRIQQDWHDCTRCPLGLTAFRHVLWDEPKTPLDILFVGEAPGRAEDAIGKPFIGPSGKLLRGIIEEVNEEFGLVWGITNLVACRPTDEEGKDRPPVELEINTCRPRLTDTVNAFTPLAVVTLGRVPERHIIPALKGLRVTLHHAAHPAAILRRGGRSASDFPEYVSVFRRIFESVNEVSE